MTKILSFGEVLYDIFPDAKHLGGAPMNFAAHAAAQGATSYLLSAVGRDALGDDAIKELSALGICTDLVARTNRPTGQCIVTKNEAGLPQYNLFSGVAYDAIPYAPAPKGLTCLYFGTLALRTKENRETLCRLLKETQNALIFSDVNVRPPHTTQESICFALSHAHILKISDEELPTVLSAIGEAPTGEVEKDIRRVAAHVPHLRLLILTRGGDGATCYEKAKDAFHTVPAHPAKAVSTVGAGDSFSAAFLTHYLAGKSIAEALTFAARVAAFVVSHTEAVPKGLPTA